MDLYEYRFKFHTPYSKIARKVGCSRNYLTLIANKQIRPGKFLAKAIELATDGHVTVEEIMKGCPEKETKEKK